MRPERLDDEHAATHRRPVRGVLEEPLLAVEPADIERQSGRGHDHDHRHREQDEDLARIPPAAPSCPARQGTARHQLATIVTSDVSPRRPFMSLGRNWGMSGMTRSWWYVARTVI